MGNVTTKSIMNYSVNRDECLYYSYNDNFIHTALFESIRKKEPTKKTKRGIPEEYTTEIKALELCCQHRSHCLVHDLVGFIQVRIFICYVS